MNDLFVNTASVAAGTLVALAIFVDVFGTAILPRPMRSLRLSRLLWAVMWNGWRSQAAKISNEDTREKMFGVYAPLTLIAIIFFWLASAIIGFGLIAYGLRTGIRPEPRTLGEAMYAIGVTVLTIGYGDYTPISAPTRIVALLAATAGPGLFAITVTFLFSTLGSFQRREIFIASIDELTGTPASGVHFLERHAELGLIGDFPQSMREGRIWIAEILENHLAYPILPYFRSTHRGESWIGTLGALLDAAALAVSALDDVPTGQARLLLAAGTHLTADLAEYFIPSHEHDAHTNAEVGIERTEFEHALASLRARGYAMRSPERAWPIFVSLRKDYASDLNVLARNLHIPPARWIGDRSLIAHAKHTRAM